jgi:hypothetical protein
MQEILYRKGVFYLNSEDRKANFDTEENDTKFNSDTDMLADEAKLKYRGRYKHTISITWIPNPGREGKSNS